MRSASLSSFPVDTELAQTTKPSSTSTCVCLPAALSLRSTGPQVHPRLDKDILYNLPKDFSVSYANLKLSLYSNIALAHLQAKPVTANAARAAITAATSALAIDGALPGTATDGGIEEDKVRRPLTTQEKVKALYRRAQAYRAVKEPEAAMKDLTEAKTLSPGDATIEKELAQVRASVDAEKKKKQAAFSKMFA